VPRCAGTGPSTVSLAATGRTPILAMERLGGSMGILE
jgi:hypothetical protein